MFNYCPSSHTMRQNPSLMSILLDKMLPSFSGTIDHALMISSSTNPIWSIASSGAHFLVALFVDSRRYPATISSNERSRITQYFLDLCGIIARGESLSSFGRFFFNSS